MTQPVTTSEPKRPDAVRFAALGWLVAFSLEIIHQITQMVMSFLDPADLINQAGQMAEDVTAEQVRLSVYGSVVFLGIFNLMVGIGLLVAVYLHYSGHKYADSARRVAMIFSFFFALRCAMIFGASPSGSHIPTWLWLGDGSMQVVLAVAAITAWVYSRKPESFEWLAKISPDQKWKSDHDNSSPRS